MDDCLMLPYNVHKPLFSPKISAILYQLFFTFCCLQITSLQAYIQFRKLRRKTCKHEPEAG